MSSVAQRTRLEEQIHASETQLEALKTQLQNLEQQMREARVAQLDVPATTHSHDTGKWPLEPEEYKRYGRQLIMPEIGPRGQLRLKKARVLIVGVGGLGCPAAAYLAGAGVGTLGLMDGDTVELSNLHRQVAHSTSRTGMSKVDSAYEYLRGYVVVSLYCYSGLC